MIWWKYTPLMPGLRFTLKADPHFVVRPCKLTLGGCWKRPGPLQLRQGGRRLHRAMPRYRALSDVTKRVFHPWTYAGAFYETGFRFFSSVLERRTLSCGERGKILGGGLAGCFFEKAVE
jgi:hypothetical protein